MLIMARVNQLIEKYTAMRDMYKQFKTEGAIATVKLCDEVLQDLQTETKNECIEVEPIDWNKLNAVVKRTNQNNRIA